MMKKALIFNTLNAIILAIIISGCSTNARQEKLTQEAITDYNAGRFSASLTTFSHVAKRKNKEAFHYLGRHYHFGEGVPKNYKTAAQYYQKAVDLNYHKSMNNLGLLYQYGAGVEKNLSKAESLYLKAAQNGIPQATNNLAFLYYSQDYNAKKTFKWMHKAALQGYSEAENTMGVYYFNGVGVAKNYKTAATWFAKAAKKGNSNGETNLGLSYLYGYGLNIDKNKGVLWLKKAVKKNHSLAQLLLGQSYMKGMGVRTNIKEAKRLCNLAHNNGQAGAKKCLSDIRQAELANQRRYAQQSQRARKQKQQTDTGDVIMGLLGLGVALFAADAIIDSFSSSEPQTSSAGTSSCREKAANRISKCWYTMDTCNTVGCNYKLTCNKAKNGSTGRRCMGFWENLSSEMGHKSDDFYCDTENTENWHSNLNVVINKICH